MEVQSLQKDDTFQTSGETHRATQETTVVQLGKGVRSLFQELPGLGHDLGLVLTSC